MLSFTGYIAVSKFSDVVPGEEVVALNGQYVVFPYNDVPVPDADSL
jgi:hypothetical protein